MGTKRVGLARVEALIENLKRDLTLGSGGGVSLADSTTGIGYHELFEVVTITATSHADDVCGVLSKKLPAQARIVDAAIVADTLAAENVGAIALHIHSSDVAIDAAKQGTEIIGADTAGDASLPDADLDISSDANAGAVVTYGTLAAQARGTDETFFLLANQDDISTISNSPKVGVYIKWFGPAAVAK